MAAWRRRAQELFPDLMVRLAGQDSIYELFFELLPLAIEAHKTSNDAMLRKVFGFAEWCLQQRAEDLWNSAGVAFYEHLFDDRCRWTDVIPWLSPFVVENCWSLWEARLEPEAMADLEEMMRTQKVVRYREVYSAPTGSGTSGNR